MRALFVVFLFETALLASVAVAGDFSFAVPNEIHSLDPAKITSTDSAFFFPQIYRGLFRYHSQKGLVKEGAEDCKFETKLKILCTLNAKFRWSDGSAVVAEDYVRGWQNLIGKESRSPAVELLSNVVGVTELFSGKNATFGVKAVSPRQLEITLHTADPDFLYKLASPVLVPVKTLPVPTVAQASQVITNGPYKIAKWEKGKKARLEINPHYPLGNPKRPSVELYFVTDDETALSLYKAGRLKLVRRLQALEVPKFKGTPDYHEFTVARFDYLGFGPELENEPELRKAMSLAVDYSALRKLMDSPGEWGCPSMPEAYMKDVPCLRQDLAAAKAAFNKTSPALRSKRLRFAFSSSGGEHIKRSAEYFQEQWRKNLGLRVDLEQTENAVFLELIKRSPPALFRKGVALDRPTCLAGVEIFIPGAPENFLRLNLPHYTNIVEKLKTSEGVTSKRELCSRAIRTLLENYRLIPLGKMDFAFLVKPQFKGWHINEMNQLDLSNLSYQE